MQTDFDQTTTFPEFAEAVRIEWGKYDRSGLPIVYTNMEPGSPPLVFYLRLTKDTLEFGARIVTHEFSPDIVSYTLSICDGARNYSFTNEATIWGSGEIESMFTQGGVVVPITLFSSMPRPTVSLSVKRKPIQG